MRPHFSASLLSRKWLWIISGVALFLPFCRGAAAQAADVGWPRTIQSDSETIQVYQPQAEKWDQGKLTAREAIVISQKNLGQAIYGVAWLAARTSVNQATREVTLYDIEVTEASFPSASTEESHYITMAKTALRNWSFSIALDRLLADLAITQSEEKAGGEVLNAAPPKIYVREKPALLVLIDGEPVLRKVNDTEWMRVINTPAVILLDTATGEYYLEVADYWMVAPALPGPWAQARKLPHSLSRVLEEERQQNQASSGPIPAATSEAPPEILVSTEPAELIQLNGEAQYSPIQDTKLLYASNTASDLFLNMAERRYYLLLSGRWFSAATLDGPWSFVPGTKLPRDFARIPPESAKGGVLASIPGTLQARDAVVAAEVPQTATVNRKEATFTATYDGTPRFQVITGTDMSYAINSPDYVLRVGERYYAVNDGVWFDSDDPLGPWVVCDYVPSEIYSIPPTVPVYPAKFVYVYDATPDFVYVGYLPGYFGAFVWDGVVVYGTGYWYPGWSLDFWYGWPWTWGFGWQYAYWGWGFRWLPVYSHPWYWRRWRHPGWGYGSWSQRILYNRSLEQRAAHVSAPNRTVYDRWKSPAVTSLHPVSLRSPAGGLRPHLLPGQLPRTDIYAGPDGYVYEHRNDGWYRRNGQTWQKVTPAPGRPQPRPLARPTPPISRPQPRPAAPRPHASLQQLNQQRQARMQGQSRVIQFRNMRTGPARPPAASRPPGRPHR